jgi:serine/threonine-protein kinase
VTAQPSPPALLSHIGKYEILRVIGSGGSGIVYEALHPELKKRVAVKTLHPKLAESPEERRRFLREGEAASRIRHPHVVDITDVGEHDGQPFLVMEYLEGQDLKSYLQRRGPLPLVEAVNLMLPVVAAVGAGHQAGVLHRDLKPHNIFMAAGQGMDPHPKVLDFGVSKLVDPNPAASVSWSGVEVILGTLCYMAPEQVRGVRHGDPRTDQYALGLILYECVTGTRVHGGDDQVAIIRKIAEGIIQPPSLERPDLPPIFEAALMQALATHPEHRFASVHDFGRALLPFASERVALVWHATFELPPATPRTGPLRPTLMLDAADRLPPQPHTFASFIPPPLPLPPLPPPLARERPRTFSVLRLLMLLALPLVVGAAVAALFAGVWIEDLAPESVVAPTPQPPRRPAAFESFPQIRAPTPPPAEEKPTATEPIPEARATRAGARSPARPARRTSPPVARPAGPGDYPVGANQAPIITD